MLEGYVVHYMSQEGMVSSNRSKGGQDLTEEINLVFDCEG